MIYRGPKNCLLLLTEDQVTKLVRLLRDKGLSLRETGKLLDVNHTTVKYYLVRSNRHGKLVRRESA